MIVCCIFYCKHAPVRYTFCISFLYDFMFKNFTEEYKQALLSGENTAKKQEFSSLEIYDVVHEVLSRKNGNSWGVFNEFGINEKVFLDVMTHPKFQPLTTRK